jgi:hypothetical protein
MEMPGKLPRVLPMAAVLVTLAGAMLAGCSSGETEATQPEPPGDVPTNLDEILTFEISDEVGDLEVAEGGGAPPWGVPDYPPADLESIRLGVADGYLYMRVEFAGTIPRGPVHLQASGAMEEQIVQEQGMNVSLDVDNNDATGGPGGVDIFFAVAPRYKWDVLVYANWDFAEGDMDQARQQRDGQLVAGGRGYDYVVVRYPVGDLGFYFPMGETVGVMAWSEAESVDPQGNVLYHHFAFDPVADTTWTIPEEK